MGLSTPAQSDPGEHRGREARLRPEYAALYPGLEPGVWLPVETTLRQVATLLQQSPDERRTISGERLLRADHFEFRGDSPRPRGLPAETTRLSDSDISPKPRLAPEEELESSREELARREREAERGVEKAEELLQASEEARDRLERLREQAARDPLRPLAPDDSAKGES